MLKLDDLAPVDPNLPVRLSFLLGFTNYRRTQLARSLECLARQSWKEFEVLICDDGSTQDMESVYKLFRPYLRMKTYRLERDGFSGCPTRAIKAMIPNASGEVWVIMQPEMMLVQDAAFVLYSSHFGEVPVHDPNYWVYKIAKGTNLHPERGSIRGDEKRYICFKTGFFDSDCQSNLNGTDWHSNVKNVEKMPTFWTHGEGLSHMDNHRVLVYDHWPWWFVGSIKASDDLWKDMPVTRGHASIDFWLLNYRYVFDYVDICPKSFMAYHQFHIRASVAPQGEQDSVSHQAIMQQKGITEI